MRGKRYTEEQIIGIILKAHEAGAKVIDLVRQHGISEQSFYRWKSKFGGMEVSDAKRLREQTRQTFALFGNRSIQTSEKFDQTDIESVVFLNAFLHFEILSI